MVAIRGHETNYGAYTGNFDLLRSLASLAYEGRRRELFAGEFIAGLKILDRGIPREQLKGSWAGATGNPQFLPSVYLRLARDGDGDGRADNLDQPGRYARLDRQLLRQCRLATGSAVGCRGQRAGVARPAQHHQPDGQPALPARVRTHSRWRTMAEWRALGLVPQGRRWPAIPCRRR